MKCLFCGGELCWNNDFTRDDTFADGEEKSLVSTYTCLECGRDYEITEPTQEEKNTTYKEYWKDA